MKRINLIGLFVILSGAAFAQKAAPDSIYLFGQDARVLNFVQQNGTQLVGSDLTRINNATVAYQTANGHFRTSQQAEKGSDLVFRTSGINTLGRFKLYGSFSFTRSWQDSLAWSLQGVPNDINPYYFIAGKAGKYQRINYNIDGIATYRLTKERLFIASGLNYFYNTASRSVDPRPSVQTFRLMLTPELIYKYKGHTLGGGVIWGYEHEENSVGYRNQNFATSSLYPDRITYRLEGYGFLRQPGSRRLIRRSDVIGGQLNYAYSNNNKYLRAGAAYKEQTEDDYTPLTNSENNQHFASFFLKQYEGNLLAGINGNRFRHQFFGKVNVSEGNDSKDDLGGTTNYRYSGMDVTGGYRLQTKGTSSVNFEAGLNALYHQHSKRDISTGHAMDISYLQPGIELGLIKKFRSADRLALSVMPAIKLPQSNSLQQPNAPVVPFTYNIFYPDYTYYTSKVGSLGFKAEYVTRRLFKDVYGSIAANAVYYKPLETGTVYSGSLFVPSGNFLNSSVSVNLYF